MRSSTRFIEVVLAGAGVAGVFGCSDQANPNGSLGVLEAALGQNLLGEVEPNASSAQATVIGSDVVVRANVVPDGDVNYYRFRAEAGTRVYAATATAFSSATDAFTALDDGDSLITLLGPDGTSELQSDDDHGSIGANSSSIAGAPIATAGNYFLRVREYDTGAQLRPYDLHVRLHDGAPAAEVEPNDASGPAQALPRSGFVAGSLSSATDVDVFSLTLAAGDTVFASLDLDPARNGSAWDGKLELGPFAGTFLVTDDHSGGSIPSEALFATVKAAGNYSVRVASSEDAGEFGAYHLSVSVHPATEVGASCTTYTSTDVPKAIPDAGRATSTITVPGAPRIEDLDVSLQLSHAFSGDLDVHLRSPAGNDIALFTDVDSRGPAIDLRIDDEAAFPLTEVRDFYFVWATDMVLAGLSVQPETTNFDEFSTGSRLHWFDGENAGGTWTLVVDDDGSDDSGSLTSWAITVCQPSVRACSGGAAAAPIVSANFDADAQGFTTSGLRNQWARGVPTAAPSFVGCDGGSGQCWKTNLTGNYADDSVQDLASPSIDLTNAVPPITLSWAMKYSLESASYDHAYVEVRDTAMASRSRRVWEFLDQTMVESFGATDELVEATAGWGTKTVDLSAYAGRTVQVVFHLDSDEGYEFGGLAVDDFSVTHCPGGGGGSGGTSGTGGGAGDPGEGGAAGASEGGTGPGGGPSEGGTFTGGSAPRGGSGNGATGGSAPMGGTSGDLGGEGGEGNTTIRNVKELEVQSSCGCRVPGKHGPVGLPTLLSLALGAVALRRRRRR